MTNHNYVKGYNLERRVKKYFESQGYKAVRSSGSHGEYDIWAFNGEKLWLIQCKAGGTVKYAEEVLKGMVSGYTLPHSPASLPVALAVVTGMKKEEPLVAALVWL